MLMLYHTWPNCGGVQCDLYAHGQARKHVYDVITTHTNHPEGLAHWTTTSHTIDRKSKKVVRVLGIKPRTSSDREHVDSHWNKPALVMYCRRALQIAEERSMQRIHVELDSKLVVALWVCYVTGRRTSRQWVRSSSFGEMVRWLEIFFFFLGDVDWRYEEDAPVRITEFVGLVERQIMLPMC